LENLRNKRNAILPLEVLVQSKRKELQDKVANEMNILNRHKENINDLKTKLSNKQNEKQKLDSDTEEQKENLKKLTVELESKLSASRFANRKQLEAALLDYETKTEYKKTEKQINSKVIGIETLISETLKEETVLEKERTFETTEEEALSDLESLNTEKETLLNRKGEVNNMFENDKLLRLRNSEILKEIEQQQKVVNKWDTLFSLLGGTKEAFNIYVQRLTLKGLINHANLHLSDLSQRYSLRLSEVYSKNEELNIRLIDHFQSNTVRAVETCSGGESFLLSLALALGLSDMASRNVIIESLFIDEGFGTLDDDLLDTVISSLETLHGKGKIIGVISHVEKLKERISTQIQVNKKGNGVSSIELL
jgi:exonuclease SbcC